MAVASSPSTGASLSVDYSQLVPVLQQLVQTLSSLVQAIQGMLVPAGAPAATGQATAGANTLTAGGGPGSSDPAQGGMSGCGCGGMGGAMGGVGDLGTTSDAGAGPAGDPGPPPAANKDDKKPDPPHQEFQSPGNLVSGPAKHSKKENALVVADVAKSLGIDPVLAVADMLVESNGDNTNGTGDGGTSFGLFQLHVHGELPKDWEPGKAGHDNVFDPRKNAEVALKVFAANKDKYSGAELAYHSQRPADHAGYVKAVNSRMDEARQLLGL